MQCENTDDDPFAEAPVGLARLGPDGSWQRTNRQLHTVLGYDAEQLRKLRLYDVVHPEGRELCKTRIAELLQDGHDEYSQIERLIKRDGTTVVVHLSVRLIMDDQGRGDHFMVAIQDMSKIHQRLEQLEHRTRFDRLTQIRNRAGFIECVRDAYRDFQRQGTAFALAYLDLDDFKAINDTLGHVTGDMLLKAVASRLSEAVGREGVVARIGGDEFAIMLNNATFANQMYAVTYRVHNAFAPPFFANGHHVSATASIGLAHCPRDARTIRGLLQYADKEMYAKKNESQLTHQTV